MEGFLIPVFMLVVIASIIAVAAYVSHQYEKKRTQDLRDAAEKLGLRFDDKGSQALLSRLHDFELFSKGDSRRMTNMLYGDTGDVEMGVFDYRYSTGSGKNRHTYHQSVIFIGSDELNVPQFFLGPENFFHRMANWFGYDDIDFDTHPKFSDAYLLRGPHEQKIRQLFTPQLLEFFEQMTGWTVEGNGGRLIAFRAAMRTEVPKLRELMDSGYKIFGAIRDHGGKVTED